MIILWTLDITTQTLWHQSLKFTYKKSGHFNLKLLHHPQSLTKESPTLQSRKIKQAQIWEPTTQTIKLKSSTILNLSKHAEYKLDTKTLNNITLNTATHKSHKQRHQWRNEFLTSFTVKKLVKIKKSVGTMNFRMACGKIRAAYWKVLLQYTSRFNSASSHLKLQKSGILVTMENKPIDTM